mgnify:CR=1 FL=1
MAKSEIATFAGGCFWGVEDLFRKVPGVMAAVSGYIGGSVDNPDYRSVCSGTTGHAEAVQITFDPEQVSYKELLHFFWEIHDPTTLNRQGPDVGTQYRSEIFTHSDEQMAEAEASKEWAQQFFSQPIVTAITPATEFFPAEEYHQEYFIKNGGHGCHIRRPIGR